MPAYPEAYLDEVIETQGKLFDFVAQNYPEKDTADFIRAYMKSDTRSYVDNAQPYVNTMDIDDLWRFFLKTDQYQLKDGIGLSGFVPNWIGEFYAFYQWKYDISSRNLVDQIPVEFLVMAYGGLHDLDLQLAAKKVNGEEHGDLFS